MDLYQVLRVSVNASNKEIVQAYQRLIKECRYNTQLNRKDIELAYRILTNPKQKAAYDAKLESSTRRTEVSQKKERKRRKLPHLENSELRKKFILIGILLFVTLIFYLVRYAFLWKEFEEGDILYHKQTKSRYGRILKYEENHNFGKYVGDAYFVETDKGQQWVPDDIVESYCYTP
jgi:curved DNA-binding protein CbpA